MTTELSDRPAFEFDENKKNFGSLDEQIKNWMATLLIKIATENPGIRC